MTKRIVSFVLAVLLLTGLLPHLGVQVQARECFLDPAAVDGYQYSSAYGEKLNQIFRGEVDLFHKSTVRYPLGSSMNTRTNYSVAGVISGSQCYIYAQAVYYYLFGDVVYHGDGLKYWSDSTKVLKNQKTASYNLFEEKGVGFGAYIRTTTSSTGAYNGDKGHSMIVLDYCEDSITFLEGNADGKGLVRITEMTWEEFNEIQLSGRGRRIAHVVQCNSAACEHREYNNVGVCERCGFEYDFSATFHDDCAGYYVVTAEGGTVLRAKKPYVAAQELCAVDAGTYMDVLGSVTNQLGESWLQVSYEDNIAYARSEDLTEDTVTPGAPKIKYDAKQTDAKPAVFTWAATANTTHYDMLIQIKTGEDQWETYAELLETSSGVSVELPAGQYRVQLWAYNAEALMPDGDEFMYTRVQIELTVTHSHRYTAQVLKEASCTAQGEEFLTCQVCGHQFNRTVDKLDHDYQDKYCTQCGQREPAVTELRISLNAGTGKPVLSWNAVTGAKKYEVYRATSENGKYTRRTTTTKKTYTDSKASAGTEYFYKIRVVSSKSAINGKYSWAESCRTACAQPSLTVKADAATGKPSLSWKSVTGADSYRVYRRVSGEGELLPIAEVTGKSYLDRDAQVDTEYEYAVQAVDKKEGFDSALSTVRKITALCARPVLSSTLTDSGKPVISWPFVEGAVSYKVYRSTSSGKNYKQIGTTAESSYTDESAAAGKTYYYKVIAVSESGESAYSSYKKSVSRCAIPVLSVQAGSSGKPVLSWNKITNAKKYEIYRSVNGGSFKKLTTTTKTSYTDSKATSGTECVYKVRALGSSSSYHSPFSDPHGCNVRCGTAVVTAKVDALTGQPSLTWKKVTGAVSYEIYRSIDGGEYLLAATQSAVSYKDTEAQPGISYSYKVVALGAEDVFHGGESKAVSVIATCAQPKLTGTIGEEGKPVLTWNEVEHADGYAIYRSTSKSKGYKWIGETDALTYTDTTAGKNKTYYYKIVALAEDTQSAQSSYSKLKAKK